MHIENQVLRNRRGRSGGLDRHGATPELVPVRPISPHLAAGAVLLVALVAAACGSTPTSAVSANTHAKPDTAHSAGSGTSAAAIRSTTNAALGTILVDSAGATLYRFTADRNGQSSCSRGGVEAGDGQRSGGDFRHDQPARRHRPGHLQRITSLPVHRGQGGWRRLRSGG